jgi:protoporphyrinogen oxidase
MESVAIIGAGITGLTAAFDVVPGLDKLELP